MRPFIVTFSIFTNITDMANPRKKVKPSPSTDVDDKDKTASSVAIERETKKNIAKVLEIEDSQKLARSVTDRIADAIANFFGSIVFVWVHILWFGGWILVNSLPSVAFDPFPYTFLTLVVSLEAIFLSTFILISQNHETRITERRNHLDLQINLLTEQENTTMLKLLADIANKVGVSVEDQKAVKMLTEDVDPKTMIEQINDATMSEKEKNNIKKANV